MCGGITNQKPKTKTNESPLSIFPGPRSFLAEIFPEPGPGFEWGTVTKRCVTFCTCGFVPSCAYTFLGLCLFLVRWSVICCQDGCFMFRQRRIARRVSQSKFWRAMLGRTLGLFGTFPTRARSGEGGPEPPRATWSRPNSGDIFFSLIFCFHFPTCSSRKSTF